ncbi:MAG: hypothetical protein ACI9WU_001312, partial [Myxococcota bacterium]
MGSFLAGMEIPMRTLGLMGLCALLAVGCGDDSETPVDDAGATTSTDSATEGTTDGDTAGTTTGGTGFDTGSTTGGTTDTGTSTTGGTT